AAAARAGYAADGDGRTAQSCRGLAVAASGWRDLALAHTARCQAATRHNDAQWYLDPGRAFGFAASEDAIERRRGGADVGSGGERLSWHLDGNGGYRAGWTECLNSDSSWRKLVLRRSPSQLSLDLQQLLVTTAHTPDASALGSLVELIPSGSADASARVHSCILRCRSPAFFHRLWGASAEGSPDVLTGGSLCPASQVLHGTTETSLSDLVTFFYSGQLPWEAGDAAEVEDAHSGQLLREDLWARVQNLASAAQSAEVLPLLRLCRAWLEVSSLVKGREGGSDILGAATFDAGAILGQGMPGVILEDDVGSLLGELNQHDQSGHQALPSDLVRVVLGRCRAGEEGQGPGAAEVDAHRVILAARSGFFRALLGCSWSSEQSSGVVHLGFVEDLGLWRPGESCEPLAAAFAALLRFLYTCRTDHVKPTLAVDLLAILTGNFLQIADSAVLERACQDAIFSPDLSPGDAVQVASRSLALGFAEPCQAAMARLAAGLGCTAAAADSPRSAAGISARALASSLPRELLLDLVGQLATSLAPSSRSQH
ncbi:unnamed protein product, partial [Polarella glacialis]